MINTEEMLARLDPLFVVSLLAASLIMYATQKAKH